MSILIGILTFILVVNCLFMILLILVQLPKKEAGLGTAFGSSATDALFGAGTGNALTKLTKYCTVIFLALTLGLSILSARQENANDNKLEESLRALQGSSQPDASLVPPQSTNLDLSVPVATNTPAPPVPPTNALNVTVPEPADGTQP
jgi:preprotein translocase subunit SecG